MSLSQFCTRKYRPHLLNQPSLRSIPDTSKLNLPHFLCAFRVPGAGSHGGIYQLTTWYLKFHLPHLYLLLDSEQRGKCRELDVVEEGRSLLMKEKTEPQGLMWGAQSDVTEPGLGQGSPWASNYPGCLLCTHGPGGPGGDQPSPGQSFWMDVIKHYFLSHDLCHLS